MARAQVRPQDARDPKRPFASVDAKSWTRRVARFVHDPSAEAELAFKIAMSTALFGATIAVVLAWMIHVATHGGMRAAPAVIDTAVLAGGERALVIETLACSVLLDDAADGAEVRAADTSAAPPVHYFYHASAGLPSSVSLRDTGSCLVVKCSGPSAYPGYVTTARVSIGRDARTALVFAPPRVTQNIKQEFCRLVKVGTELTSISKNTSTFTYERNQTNFISL